LQLEPAVDSLGIIGAVIGIFAEREAAQREVREQTLRMLAEELLKNTAILADARFSRSSPFAVRARVYPRLVHSAVDSALLQGGLVLLRDIQLANLFRNWRDSAAEFNRRLDVTEMRSFIAADSHELRALNEALHGENGPLVQLNAQLVIIQAYLIKQYSHEKAIREAGLTKAQSFTKDPNPAY
jgi:hypothetical protein